MMDGRAAREQGSARCGIFGRFAEGDHLLAAGADAAAPIPHAPAWVKAGTDADANQERGDDRALTR